MHNWILLLISIYPSHLRNSPTGVESGLRNGMFRKCVRRAGYCPRPAPAKPAGKNIDIRSGGAFTKHFPFRNTAKLTKLQYYTHTYALNAPHSSVTHTLHTPPNHATHSKYNHIHMLPLSPSTPSNLSWIQGMVAVYVKRIL